MARLGYQRYGAQGGDWGSAISPRTRPRRPRARDRRARERPDDLPHRRPGELDNLSDQDEARLGLYERFRTDFGGYLAIQSTRPQTLAFGLADSPVGQLAWIAEKFKEWTDSRERPEDAVDRDALLTNVTLVLADQHRRLLGPLLLRIRPILEPPRLVGDPAGCRGVPPRRRAAHPSPGRTSRQHRPTGPSSTVAATSPPSNNPNSSPPTSGRSSPGWSARARPLRREPAATVGGVLGLHRNLAPSGRVPLAEVHGRSRPWQQPLLQVLLFGCGWPRPDLGLVHWLRAGRPTDDPRLELVERWWGVAVQELVAWSCATESNMHGIVLRTAEATRTHTVLKPLPDEWARTRERPEWREAWTGGYDVMHLADHVLIPVYEPPASSRLVIGEAPTATRSGSAVLQGGGSPGGTGGTSWACHNSQPTGRGHP